MGKRGPSPQPAALRLLNGAQPSKVPDEPIPKPGKMRPPPGTSPAVAEIFNETVAYLEDMKIAYPCDAPSLAIYANAVHQYREATGVIDRTSLLVKYKSGVLERVVWIDGHGGSLTGGGNRTGALATHRAYWPLPQFREQR